MKKYHTPKKITLCRYGGIGKLIKQKGNFNKNVDDNEMTFHQAPERHGYYAFLYPYIELFLLGSPTNKAGKNNDNIKYNGRFTEFKNGTYKIFQAKDGTLWTHIKPKKNYLILDRKGSWFKVNVCDFHIIIKQEMARMHGECIGHGYPSGTNPTYLFSKDHLEVFITKDTKINS